MESVATSTVDDAMAGHECWDIVSDEAKDLLHKLLDKNPATRCRMLTLLLPALPTDPGLCCWQYHRRPGVGTPMDRQWRAGALHTPVASGGLTEELPHAARAQEGGVAAHGITARRRNAAEAPRTCSASVLATRTRHRRRTDGSVCMCSVYLSSLTWTETATSRQLNCRLPCSAQEHTLRKSWYVAGWLDAEYVGLTKCCVGQLEQLVCDASSSHAKFMNWEDFVACTMSRQFYLKVRRASNAPQLRQMLTRVGAIGNASVRAAARHVQGA